MTTVSLAQRLARWASALGIMLCAALATQHANAAGMDHSQTVGKHVAVVKAKRHRKARHARAAHRKSTSPGQSAPSQKRMAMARQHGPAVAQADAHHPNLRSFVAYVVEQKTGRVLVGKNERTVLPIASLTKLMTGTLISEARLPMDEPITITQDDVDLEKHSSSRLAVGTTLTRGEMLHLALMSSENRAAHALARTYPGGLATFVTLMNAKAQMLGMQDTLYVGPTGLSSRNESTARDLALLVNSAYRDPLLRRLTTTREHTVRIGRHSLHYVNSNRLVRSGSWDIGLQKTGFINEAGKCMVMQTIIAGREWIVVLLDSAGSNSRVVDARRVRSWVQAHGSDSDLPEDSQLAAAEHDGDG